MQTYRGYKLDGSRVVLPQECDCIWHEGPHWIALAEWRRKRLLQQAETGEILAIGDQYYRESHDSPAINVNRRTREVREVREEFESRGIDRIEVEGNPRPTTRFWARRQRFAEPVWRPSQHDCGLYSYGDENLIRRCCVRHAEKLAIVAAAVSFTSEHPSYRAWLEAWNWLTTTEVEREVVVKLWSLWPDTGFTLVMPNGRRVPWTNARRMADRILAARKERRVLHHPREWRGDDMEV